MEIRHTFESKNPPKSLELAVLGCHVYPETLLGTCCLGGGGVRGTYVCYYVSWVKMSHISLIAKLSFGGVSWGELGIVCTLGFGQIIATSHDLTPKR